MNTEPSSPPPAVEDASARIVDRLRANRPRNRFLRGSALVVLAIVVLSWGIGELGLGDTPIERRIANLQRFVREITPYPLQKDEGWSAAGLWFSGLMHDRGWSALANTLSLSVASIVLAAAGAALFSPLSARNVASAAPFSVPPGRRVPVIHWAWSAVALTTRGALIFVRSIPEYILAYLLLAFLGPQAWPLVLALALHNMGILGRLGAEAIENTPRSLPAERRAAGLSRTQIVATQILPSLLPRLLVYFFYRWETCLRDATVLGMLGFASLGFFIVDSRARQHYDEMMVFVVLAVALILAGDFVSWLVRRTLRTTG